MQLTNCTTANLDYNNVPHVQNSILGTQYYEYPCLTSSTSDTKVPLEFRHDKTNQFTDLTQIYLSYTVQVFKADGSKLSDTDVVSTVNNFCYTIFSGIDIFIQDQNISGGEGYYPYLAYVSLLLGTSEEEKKYYLRQSLWRRDEAGLMDKMGTDEAGAVNKGFTERAGFIQNSAKANIFLKVIPGFQLHQLIPDQTELFFRFHRSAPTACLLAEEGDFQIRISEAKLLVARSTLTNIGNNHVQSLLRTKGLTFPANRLMVKSKTVSKNDQNCEWTPFSGILPRRIYIFQTLNSAYNGKINKNIFNFQTFKLKRIQAFRNGESLPVTSGISVSSDSSALLYTFSLNAINKPKNISFNLWEYNFGYMIGCFDMTSDCSAGMSNYENPKQTSTIRLRLDYDEALEETITVFCMAEEAVELYIDSDRNPRWIE